MYLDKQNEFSDAQSVSTLGATNSTNLVDTGAGGDAGGAEPLYLVVQVDETVTSGGASTVAVSLEGADQESFSSPRTLWQGAAVGKSALLAGYRVAAVAVPQGADRFLRVKYTVGTAALTSGSFSAFLVRDPQNWTATPDAL